VWAHEISHVLDDQVVNKATPWQRFSLGPEYTSAADQDPYAATPYGREKGYVEEFADVGRLSIYNKNVPGGLAGAGINTSGIARQLSLYERVVGNINVKGGTCTADKVASSEAVPINNGRVAGPKPDVSGTGNIPPVIDGPIFISPSLN
jgi:hypothetical protein